jgi:hypothetical protein
MDESPDHEPTPIERGMGIHLNHPLAARRGIRNPRPDRRGLWKPHPPSRGGTARARLEQDGGLALIASKWDQARGLDARLHLLGAPNVRVTSHARATEVGWNIADAG